MRRAAGIIAALITGCALAGAAGAEAITAAEYADPTTRYLHGVLGDTIEHGALILRTDRNRSLRIVLPDTRVFEDTAPRLADLDGDGAPEVIVVESHASRGARLAVYGISGLIAANDWIGQTNRWLAPVGAADLDGDGAMEIAFVDRPHLARVLRVVRFAPGALVPVAELEGLSNHRIGETDIAGGIRDCGAGPEMIVADGDWTVIRAVRLASGALVARDLIPHRGRDSFARAMACAE